MKQKAFSIMIFLIGIGTIKSFAQANNIIKTTQEILMSYKWIPIDIYEEEDNKTCFLTYTKTYYPKGK